VETVVLVYLNLNILHYLSLHQVVIYWEYTKFSQRCDIQRIRTKLGEISELELALNSTLLKVHVSKWYRKCYWSMLIHGPP